MCGSMEAGRGKRERGSRRRRRRSVQFSFFEFYQFFKPLYLYFCHMPGDVRTQKNKTQKKTKIQKNENNQTKTKKPNRKNIKTTQKHQTKHQKTKKQKIKQKNTMCVVCGGLPSFVPCFFLLAEVTQFAGGGGGWRCPSSTHGVWNRRCSSFLPQVIMPLFSTQLKDDTAAERLGEERLSGEENWS